MKYYFNVLENYTNFSGRARRSEYWYFALYNMIFGVVAIAIDNALGTTFENFDGIGINYGYVYLAYILFTFIPGLAVFVRRMHDIGKSGWMFLVALIPIAGAIWLLVLLFTDSQFGDNKYGPNPKAIPIQ
jgi:uncharacterized membrane protein YhaH (DUF805 family)